MNLDQSAPIPPTSYTSRAAFRAARNRHLVALSGTGMSLQEMGDLYGLTREMVRQILAHAGISGEERRQMRRRRAELLREADREVVLAWAQANPGCTRREAAEALGMTSQRLSEAIGGEAGGVFVTEPRCRDRVYSGCAIARQIQAAAAEIGNPLSKNDYDAYVVANGGITSVRILQRFGGSWNAACRAAGLEVNRGRPSYIRRWSNADLVLHVVDYLESKGATGSYADFDRWSRLDADRPSAQTVRNHVGPWTGTKRLALQEQSRLRSAAHDYAA
ncbi:homing endonuclease associated repeat-containing protein [Nocardioides sp. P5_E3]